MTLTIDLSSQEEAWLNAQALQQGVRPAEIIKKMVDERMPDVSRISEELEKPSVEIDDRSKAAIALLQSWMEEDATDDPEEIRRAEQDLEELKHNLNANRAVTGERLVFP